jgi:hypothetical protein
VAELATVAEVKTYLGISSSSDDTLLGDLLDAAETMIREWCNRENGWTKTTQEERFDGEWADKLTLTYNPIDSAATLTIKITGYGSTELTVTSSLYRVNYTTGNVGMRLSQTGAFAAGVPTIYLPTPFVPGRGPTPNLGSGFETVLVNYTGGYAAGSIPADLNMAAIIATAFLYRNRKRPIGLQSETLDRYSYTNATSLGAPINTLKEELLNGLLGGYIRRGGYS